MNILSVLSVSTRIPLLALLCLLLPGCAKYQGITEEVVIEGGGGIELYGTLAFPEDMQAPYPVVLLLHGAERATRNRMVYPLTANIFLQRGMAVLVYDKRGAGQSGGDYENTTYDQLTQDAVAAIAYLRSRNDIDPSKIGLVGVSESGWLTPEIVERSNGLAFLINKVGSTLSVRDTIAWEVYNDLQIDGVSEASAREQVELFRRIWAYQVAPDPQTRTQLQPVLTEWATRRDSQLPAQLQLATENQLVDLGYDPTPFLQRLETPAFYIYGSEDINIPTRESIARITELVAAGRPISSYVFEGGGHELGGPCLRPPFYCFAEGYAEMLGEFAAQHVFD